jgi:hypothetical protein
MRRPNSEEVTMRVIDSHSPLVAAAAILAGVGYSTPAPAIDCSGPWQKVSGQEIATPYCEDNYLGQIARAAGLRVSNEDIRTNPNKKGEVCRFVGRDNRVRDICWNYLDEDSRD